jgi:hypothetical protein
MNILCACPGCGNPRRDKSKYCCDRCSNNATRKPVNVSKEDVAREYIQRRHAIYKSVNRCGGKVSILLPGCADPYRASLEEYKRFHGAYPRGTKVTIDGKEEVL